MRKSTLGFAALAISLLVTSSASAAPVFVNGNECPADPLDAAFTRQYYVTEAIACVYDASVANIQGDAAEALMLTNGPAPWNAPTAWVGLGEEPTGFSFTADAGNDDGTFTIGAPLAALYNQFAVGVKDGEGPKWAIFLLPVNQLTGNWGFSTEGGDLSHFVLYGHNVNIQQTGDGSTAPEPALLSILGLGLVGAAARLRRRRS